MRLDAHQHFWAYNPGDYVWMGEAHAPLRRDFLPADLAPLLKAIGFDGAIAVQARQMVEETAWLLGLADRHDLIKGVVGWVDLRSADLRHQLDRFAAHPRLVGVRHVLHDEPDDRFMLLPEFRRGIAMLREFRLAYDLLLFPRHLPVAAELVRGFPEQPFVLDHLAKPCIRDRQLSPWREDLRRLAAFPNVCCKLSGMVTEAAWNGWKPADFAVYLDTVLDAFGPRRLMIGSDWPVCRLAGAYADTMGIVSDWAGRLSASEQADILGGTCARFYRITTPDGSDIP